MLKIYKILHNIHYAKYRRHQPGIETGMVGAGQASHLAQITPQYAFVGTLATRVTCANPLVAHPMPFDKLRANG